MISNILRLIHFGIEYVTTKTINDKYIYWLTFANAGMLSKGNIYSMQYAIDNLPSSNPVIEIGSFCGLSTNVISYFLLTKGKNNKMFSCDKWLFFFFFNVGNIDSS